MLVIINKIILFLLLALFGYSFYHLIITNDFYPYILIIIGTILSIGVYFSLVTMKVINSKTYLLLTILALLNLFLLFSDYHYPSVLEATWNYSIAFLFIVLLTSLLFKLKEIEGKFSVFTFWITVLSGILIVVALLFKISLSYYYSALCFTFATNSIALLLLFGSQFKRPKKSNTASQSLK